MRTKHKKELQIDAVDKISDFTCCLVKIEPVQCEECGRSFKKISDLKRHYVAHSNDCPFECEECGQRFRKQNNLKQHRLKHTNERPYECWLCHKA